MESFKSELSERFSGLLKSEKYSDTVFVLKNGEKLRAHKLILAVSSSVFDSMMYGSLAEKGEIEIKDIEPESFKTMIEFVYTDNLKLVSVSHAISVFKAGHKYDISSLQKRTAKYIQSNITTDNALEVLEFSKFFELSEIEKSCMKLLQNKTKSVLQSDYFLNCNLDTLKTLVNDDSIQISEVDLFNFIGKWADNLIMDKDVASELRNDVIMKIRFLSMTARDLGLCTSQSELLTLEEKHSLLLSKCTEESRLLPDGFCSRTEPRMRDVLIYNVSESQVFVRLRNKRISEATVSNKSAEFKLKNLEFTISCYPRIPSCSGARESNEFCVDFKYKCKKQEDLRIIDINCKILRANGDPIIKSEVFNFHQFGSNVLMGNNFSRQRGYRFGGDDSYVYNDHNVQHLESREYCEKQIGCFLFLWSNLIEGGFIEDDTILLEIDLKI